MRLNNRDLILAVFIATADIVWVLFPNHVPVVGIILALPLVFVLPGYTLTEALFKSVEGLPSSLIRVPRLKIERPVTIMDRLILSFGLSLALVIISGFVLGVLPIGLQPLSWAICLGLLTMFFSLVAAYRRHEIHSRTEVAQPRFHITIYECIQLILALAVVTGALWYSISSSQQQSFPGFTQFWMVTSQHATDGCSLQIGVQSFEITSLTYSITVTINNKPVDTWSSITLAPKQQWQKVIQVKPVDSSNSLYIQAELYRADKPGTVYREVHMTLIGTNQQIQC